jgi:membrane associated rhomboid family serine protease
MLPIGDQGDEQGGLPIVNIAVIAINVLVFVFLQLPSDAFTMAYSAIPLEITTGDDLIGPATIPLPDGTAATLEHADGPEPIWLTLFSSMFMHGGWAHLGSNMLFLFIFGDNVEKRLGSVMYIAFYLICGVLASFAQIATNTQSIIPTLGASGAISGVLAGWWRSAT